ncbi:sporulation integral membrane protein YtvI [Hathewaya histolytica]|uniref:Sporulation integral membrane protein YtvI n=1 Tax=Hathewaya histolytica TaxID=1498 RepID=A0A4U9QYQ4_HATHI|nr:sporulation integral membrane protein YtvI [Hathewaya histolytica]VTQ83699.1 sporulation integral membrane protein YtvI [Hathewaya histolytica]
MEGVPQKIDRIILFFLVYTISFVVFFGTLKYTYLFLIALIFAMILRKPTRFLMNKCKINSTLACLTTNVVFFTIIFVILYFSITSISHEIIQFGKNAQGYVTSNKDKIYALFEEIQHRYNNIDPTLINDIKSYAYNFVSKYSGSIMDFSARTVTFAIGIISNLPYLMMVVFFSIIATYFFTKDMVMEKGFAKLYKFKEKKYIHIYSEAKKKLLNYMISYLIIISLTFIETLIVFLALDIKYAVILSIISGIADILPVLGVGTIYTPLVIFYWITGNKFTAIALIISYAIISAIRQIVEPKLVSSSLGIHPVAVIAAIFIGLTVNGVMGMIYFMFLVVFYNLLKQVDVL